MASAYATLSFNTTSPICALIESGVALLQIWPLRLSCSFIHLLWLFFFLRVCCFNIVLRSPSYFEEKPLFLLLLLLFSFRQMTLCLDFPAYWCQVESRRTRLCSVSSFCLVYDLCRKTVFRQLSGWRQVCCHVGPKSLSHFLPGSQFSVGMYKWCVFVLVHRGCVCDNYKPQLRRILFSEPLVIFSNLYRRSAAIVVLYYQEGIRRTVTTRKIKWDAPLKCNP